jgi:Ca-activated chloride channel homolog
MTSSLNKGVTAVLKPFHILLVLCLLALSVFSQTAPKPTATPDIPVDDNDVIKINSRLVAVPVSITDALGRPVTGLKLTDFRLLEENKQQQLEQLSAADEVPLEIALLIDISGSVDSLFESEKLAAAKFLKDVMRPIDRASIFTIGEKPFLYQPRDTADKAAERLTMLNAQKSWTSFYDTVIRASDYLGKNAPPNSRKVIVVISDGDDSYSEVLQNLLFKDDLKTATQIATLPQKKQRELAMNQRALARNKVKDQILRTMQNADVVFYSINPAGNSLHLNTISQFGQETMKIFADQTGGNAFLMKKDTDLENIFQQLTGELRAQYLLQYYTDADFPVGKYVNLKVDLPGKTQVRIRARQGYFVKAQ